jgi:putative endonuclease
VLRTRVAQHKTKATLTFTARYNVTKLVYIEEFPEVYEAIAREKKLKGWTRAKKIALVEAVNPGWTDLSAENPQLGDV